MDDVAARLDEFEAEGFIVIEGAMTPEETENTRQRVNYAREQGWEEGLNAVGNMWFDSLLDREPEHYESFVGHASLRPYLEGMMGPQCQLRSLRAHINPGPYLQEWHMDFYGYWDEKRKAAGYRLTSPPIGVNTTFYFQDNGPGLGHLKFAKRGLPSARSSYAGSDPPARRAWIAPTLLMKVSLSSVGEQSGSARSGARRPVSPLINAHRCRAPPGPASAHFF